jgi:uncharacterized protein (DUF2236 family)
VHGVLVAAAVGLLPTWARGELHIPALPMADALVVSPVARVVCAGMRWAVTAPPAPAGPGAPGTAGSE